MIGREKDVDPASELVEEDDEQTLPEGGEDTPLDLGAGPLAAGRAALVHYAKLAPSSPGVYRMLDAAGEVLYVGKAKSIRKRITSYTRPTGLDTRIERVVANTASVEFVSTATETEALLLEANLIKRLRPRFNVLLRDDKSFPYILITGDHWAPQILKHRGARSREGSYFGPFASVWAVNRTITVLQRAFLLRSCSDGFFESRTRPCLLYQIKRCSAPCTQEIEFDTYRELVREATGFLSGKSQTVKEEMAAEMEKASAALDFERAAALRDRLREIEGDGGASAESVGKPAGDVRPAPGRGRRGGVAMPAVAQPAGRRARGAAGNVHVEDRSGGIRDADADAVHRRVRGGSGRRRVEEAVRRVVGGLARLAEVVWLHRCGDGTGRGGLRRGGGAVRDHRRARSACERPWSQRVPAHSHRQARDRGGRAYARGASSQVEAIEARGGAKEQVGLLGCTGA